MKGMRKEKRQTELRGRRISIRKLFAETELHSISMRRRLLLYLCSLILAGTGALIVLQIAMGVFTQSGRGLEQILGVQLENQKKDVGKQLEFFAGNGLNLSQRLSAVLEREILSYPYDIGELNNDAERLEEMQERIYPLLENGLNVTRASGVFAVFDATVNTEAPDADYSRSGLYLRLANVSSSNTPENEIFMFRGNPDIAGLNRIQLHNRWNMEFDTRQMEWYQQQLAGAAQSEEYLWIDRHALQGTWEDGVFLSVPIIGNSGSRYGLCGMEISSLLFRLTYPAETGSYGNIITVLAPLQGKSLIVKNGLSGGGGETGLDDEETLTVAEGSHFNTYTGNGSRYVGIHDVIYGAHDIRGRQWVIAVLLSENGYREEVQRQRMRFLITLSVFVLLMLFISFIASHRFVRPIIKALEELKSGEPRGTKKISGISEIDALVEFLEMKRAEHREDGGAEVKLPSNVEELFDQFIAHAGELTTSERNILKYYIDGHEIAEVPELACISLNTVRKHNRSIYKKLEINSRDELELYLNLLKRCGRLHELE